jgi:hypothetical protein
VSTRFHASVDFGYLRKWEVPLGRGVRLASRISFARRGSSEMLMQQQSWRGRTLCDVMRARVGLMQENLNEHALTSIGVAQP